MNHSYRLVWSDEQQRCVPVPECARGRGKGKGKGGKARRVSSVVMLAALSFAAHALPTGGAVSSGGGSITQNGSTMTVNQTTPRLALNWNSFNVGANETVNFVQPGRSAVALNRVLGSDPTAVYGHLNANGQVFLLNPNGVLFGKTAQVSVGGLVASTLGLSDSNFNAGNHTFSGASSAGVVNQGSITAADGGYVALLGRQVSNQGAISARLGNVSLAAGSDITLDLAGDGLIGLTVNQGVVGALAENRQLISADGGSVLLTARAADALVKAVVNNSGVIEAHTLGTHGGTIMLLGDMANGVVNVGGTLDASAPGSGNGGFIETSAAHVNVADDVRVTTLAAHGNTGNWLIDPNDYTIAASGGDITGALLSSQLASSNVTIQSAQGASAGNGDVFVNDAVKWSADTTLTLSAHRNVDVRANITATGNNAGLVLVPDNNITGTGTGSYRLLDGAAITLSGSNPSLHIAGKVYQVINDVAALQGVTAAAASGQLYFALGSDIDASATAGWNNAQGFAPLSMTPNQAQATFDGLGHAISNLTIDRQGTAAVGLFDRVWGTVRNVGLVGASIHGGSAVGGLAGAVFSGGTLGNTHVDGSTVTSAGSQVGGLVGYVEAGASIRGSHADSAVSGGLDEVGGLVGRLEGSISNSYASGPVTGANNLVGGLVGYLNGSISKSYAIGAVAGTDNVGGLVGFISGGTIDQSYAAGKVTSTGTSGGLFGGRGAGSFSASSSYWDINSSGEGTGWGFGNFPGITGLTTTQAMNPASYAGWDFGSDWYQVSGNTRPFLRSEYSINIRNAHELQLMRTGLSRSYTQARDLSAAETSGTNPAGMWSTGGFVPVGDANAVFTGSFDGQGHRIADLTINRPSVADQALFGRVTGATIGNVDLEDVKVAGGSVVGALLANGLDSTVINSHASGVVNGGNATGGLIGWFVGGLIQDSSFTGTVAGSTTSDGVGGLVGALVSSTVKDSVSAASVSGLDNIGGLVGVAGGSSISGSSSSGTASGAHLRTGGLIGWLINGGTVTGSSASGDVAGAAHVGGLVGDSVDSTISGGKASGNVTGSSWVGGLVGELKTGSISASQASGVVNGTGNNVGGLVGSSVGSLTVANLIDGSSATGAVSSNGTNVGGLVGQLGSYGSITNSHADGAVSGTGARNGGLVGFAAGGFIGGSYATGQVSGGGDVGGLVGSASGASISDSFAVGNVDGSNISANVGGLVGRLDSGGAVTRSYASGSVTGSGGGTAGGLVGLATTGGIANTVSNSFATGAVSVADFAGGLIGAASGTNIVNTYATGSVQGSLASGGLVGNATNNTISTSYAAGAVSGAMTFGGLLGMNQSNIVTSTYWDSTNSGQTFGAGSGGSTGITGLTSAQMQQAASFAGFDIASTGGSTAAWRIYEGQTRPMLRSFLTPLTVTAGNVTKTYDGKAVGAYGTTLGSSVAASIWHPAGTPDAALVQGSATSNAVNAGTYALDGSGLYSSQLGYDITVSGNPTLTINPAVLTVTADNAGRAVGDANPAFSATTSGLVNGESLGSVVSGSVGFATPATAASPAGFYAITPSGYVLLSGNYTLAYVDGVLTVADAGTGGGGGGTGGEGSGGGGGGGGAVSGPAFAGATGFDSAVSDAQTRLAAQALEASSGVQVVYLNADGKAVPDTLAAPAGRAALGLAAEREKVAVARGDLLLTVRDGGIRLPAGLLSH